MPQPIPTFVVAERTRMKRLFVLLLVMIPQSYFLAGCGSSSSSSSMSPPPKQDQEAMRKAQLEMMKKSGPQKKF